MQHTVVFYMFSGTQMKQKVRMPNKIVHRQMHGGVCSAGSPTHRRRQRDDGHVCEEGRQWPQQRHVCHRVQLGGRHGVSASWLQAGGIIRWCPHHMLAARHTISQLQRTLSPLRNTRLRIRMISIVHVFTFSKRHTVE